MKNFIKRLIALIMRLIAPICKPIKKLYTRIAAHAREQLYNYIISHNSDIRLDYQTLIIMMAEAPNTQRKVHHLYRMYKDNRITTKELKQHIDFYYKSLTTF